MKAMRLMFCTLVVLAFASRVDAAGFAMSDNFTVFTPAYPTQQDAEAYAHEVLAKCRGMAARDCQTVAGRRVASERGTDDGQCVVQRGAGCGAHLGQR